MQKPQVLSQPQPTQVSSQPQPTQVSSQPQPHIRLETVVTRDCRVIRAPWREIAEAARAAREEGK